MKEQQNNAKPVPTAKNTAGRSLPTMRSAPEDSLGTKKASPASPANLKPQQRPATQMRRQNAPMRGRNAPKAAVVKIYPLGGLGEIGKNLTVYECAGEMIIVDCGSRFPESDMFGIDLVIPDFSFLEQNKDKIKAIVITHGHEDHIGALPYLLREISLPIYATRLTLGLISNKLEEHGQRASTQMNLIAPREKFKLGCFTIEPIHVNHSIPGAVAFAIDCPAGIVIHTGDWKIDYTPVGGDTFDLATVAEYGKKGVLALLSDSTNAERAGSSSSESVVHAGLTALFSRADKKRVIVATFASNLFRIQLLVDLSVKSGRKVAINGRSMIKNTQMAMELGYLKVPSGVLIDIDKTEKLPPEDVTIITTGSQGETLSALSRMAAGSHRNVRVGSEDFIIISATPIPGNEKMVNKVINGLLKLGADVIYENMYDVHASGHACQEEQKLIINLTKPKYFIPVHGEYKHLMHHAKLAQAAGIPGANIYIPDSGEVICISKDGINTAETVQAGAVMVDGLGVGDVGSVVLRDRRLLSEDGIVVLAASVEEKSGHLVSGPEILSRGFVYVRDSEQLLEETRLVVEQILLEYKNQPYQDINSLKTHLREAASSLLYKRTKRSPMILPILLEV